MAGVERLAAMVIGLACLLVEVPAHASTVTVKVKDVGIFDGLEPLGETRVAAVASEPARPKSAKAMPAPVERDKQASPVLRRRTNQVAGRIGTSFGYTFVVEAAHRVNLRVVTRFPEAGMTAPRGGRTLAYQEVTEPFTPGKKRIAFFTFEENWQVVPGEWHLELWEGKEKVSDQPFVVTRP